MWLQMKEPFSEVIRTRCGKTLKQNLTFVAGQMQKDYSDIIRELASDFVTNYHASRASNANGTHRKAA